MPILVMNRRRQIVRTVRCIFVTGLLTMLLLSACSTAKPRETSPSPSTEPLQAELKVESDLKILHAVAGQLDRTRSEFMDDPVAIAKLNEQYFRSEIPLGTYDRLRRNVTSKDKAKIMDTHVNRLLVLRPLLNNAERTEFLAGVFSYLGDEYDFYFDYADASRQVCTEVQYRTLNGKGGIYFTLIERAGHVTLSADDIVNYYLETQPQQFELVLFADENPGTQLHQARVLTGAETEHCLKELMADPKP